LQAAADRFTSEVIRKQLEYWTLILGRSFPNASGGDEPAPFLCRQSDRIFRNFIFKRNFPIHKIFERAVKSAWRMDGQQDREVFGQRVTKN